MNAPFTMLWLFSFGKESNHTDFSKSLLLIVNHVEQNIACLSKAERRKNVVLYLIA